MIKLSFCRNDPPMGISFWQKDSMINHILFELCLLWTENWTETEMYLAQSTSFWDTPYVNCRYYIWLCVYSYDLKSQSFHIFWYWATYSYKGQITKAHGCKTDTKPCGLKYKSGCKYFLDHQVSTVGGRGNHCSKHTKTWKKIVKFSELVKLSE